MSTSQRPIVVSLHGSPGTGKSSFQLRIAKGHFVADWNPTISDSYDVKLEVGGELTSISILDIAAPEEHSAMPDQYLRNSDVVILFYSIADRRSFEEMRGHYYEHVLRVKSEQPFALVVNGCKSDLNDSRQVTTKEGAEFARAHNIPFFETSSKDNVYITECIEAAIQEYKKVQTAKQAGATQRPTKRRVSRCDFM